MANTYTRLVFDVVFSTKQRLPLISPIWRDELYGYIGGIVRAQRGVLLEIGGMPDHVHLLIGASPAIAISDLIRTVKSNSAKWLNENKMKMRKFGWQDGYSAFTVSVSQLQRARVYIQTQETHHKKIDFRGELIRLLKWHGIEFDPAYVCE